MDIRIVVVEDHALVREGTTELLEREPGCTVAGQAGSAEEALRLIRELRPDAALVDVELPGMNGIALARAVAEQAPDTRVIILSAYDDYAYVIGALEAGVCPVTCSRHPPPASSATPCGLPSAERLSWTRRSPGG